MDLITPNPGLIFWQALGFLLLLVILGKYAWKPILRALREREAYIDDALQAAEKARIEMTALKSENERLLDQARAERDKILSEATVVSNRLKDEARIEATKLRDKLVDDARKAIQSEKEAALRDVRKEVALLSLEIAEKLIRKNLSTDAEQKKLVEQLIKDQNIN